MSTETKRCVTCKQNRELDRFGRSKATRDGLHRQCRDCRAEAYQMAKARKANGEAPRTADNTITKGNPLSDPFTAEGWPTMMSVAASVAGRIYRQHGGWHPMSRADLESAAVEWVTDHRPEASRCQTEAMAVVKIAERVTREWRKTLRPETPGIADFPINVRDHEIMMDFLAANYQIPPGVSVARLALSEIHKRAVDHPYIDAMDEMDRVSYDQVEGFVHNWDRMRASTPPDAVLDRYVRESATDVPDEHRVTAMGGREKDVAAIEAGRARAAEPDGDPATFWEGLI